MRTLTIYLYLTGVHPTIVHLMGRCLMGVYLTGMYLMGVCLLGVCLLGVYLTGVHLIYESSLRAGHGWRESLYRHPGWLRSF